MVHNGLYKRSACTKLNLKHKISKYMKTLIENLKALRLYFVMYSIEHKSKSKLEELYENQPTHVLVEY